MEMEKTADATQVRVACETHTGVFAPHAVPVLGVKLFGAIGVGEDGPRPFFAVVEYVGLGVHSFEFEEEVG
eukprot:scaffold368_cov127-Isochrysis_galbana.AAC.4